MQQPVKQCLIIVRFLISVTRGASEMTCIVSGGALNSTHSLTMAGNRVLITRRKFISGTRKNRAASGHLLRETTCVGSLARLGLYDCAASGLRWLWRIVQLVGKSAD